MIDAPDKVAGVDANRHPSSLLQSNLRYLNQAYWGMNLQ